MLIREGINRFREIEESSPKQLLVIDTQQFFEIEIPLDVDPEDYLYSEECRKECAARKQMEKDYGYHENHGR